MPKIHKKLWHILSIIFFAIGIEYLIHGIAGLPFSQERLQGMVLCATLWSYFFGEMGKNPPPVHHPRHVH